MVIFPHLSTTGMANVYVVADDDRNGIIIDPAEADKELIAIIEDHGISVRGFFVTHSHKSHIAGLGTLLKIYSAPVYGFQHFIEDIKTERVSDGVRIRIANLEIDPISVPGHSSDSVVYRVGNAIFTGDTLLSGSIGSTGSLLMKELLIRGIREKLLSLDASTLIFPGHGSLSKIRIERMFNQDLLEGEAAIL